MADEKRYIARSIGADGRPRYLHGFTRDAVMWQPDLEHAARFAEKVLADDLPRLHPSVVIEIIEADEAKEAPAS